MPLAHFHLADKDVSDQQLEIIAREATQIYAEVLDSPIDRIRIFINLHAPNLVAAGGKMVSNGGEISPYFDFIVLQGRSLDQRREITQRFTDLLVDVLGVRKQAIRGRCFEVPPENWSIGGVLASELRKAEIEARAAQK